MNPEALGSHSAKRTFKIILVAVIFLFVIFSRFAFLTEKPFHHDESQYASFSYYNFKGSLYKYNPILHGPFLFYFNMLAYGTLGDSDFSARIGPALFGALLTLILLLMSRWLGFKTSVFLMIAYAISPSFTYYNRFLSHDTYIAFFSVLTIFFFVLHVKSRKPLQIYLTSLSLGFLLLIKISSYIYTFMFLSFLALVLLFNFSDSLNKGKREYLSTLSKQKIHLTLGFLTVFSVFFIFYTSFFRYLPGFLDGLFLKSIGYWAAQNAEQRIKGSFDYYLPIIIIYELPLLLLAVLAVLKRLFSDKTESTKTIAAISVGTFVSILLANVWVKTVPGLSIKTSDFFDTYFHLEAPYHVFLVLLFLYCGTSLTVRYLKENKPFSSFVSFWLFFSLLVYGYAGEKVPWLSLNITMPLLFFAALSFDDLTKSRFFKTNRTAKAAMILFVSISIAWTVFINLRLNIYNSADPKERLVYVQTSEEMIPIVKKIKELSNKTGEKEDFKISVNGEAAWPLNWCLRRYKSIFPPPDIEDEDNKVIIVDYRDRKLFEYLNEEYESKHVKLREWWVPDMGKKVGLKKFIYYYIFREIWNTKGSQDILVFTKKGIE